LNSYEVAFGILGLGVFLAVLLWSIPHLRRHRQVRSFRKALTHVDVVTLAWSQAVREDRSPSEVSDLLPEDRRARRTQRRRGSDDGGAALV
jgi:hypothetical protein